MAADDKWMFLEPWRRLLRLLVRLEDHEELLVGTLHEQLRCVRLNLFHYEDVADEDELGFDWGDGRPEAVEACRYAVLTRLREALELIGLALHYDKRVWRWLRPEYGLPTFDYDDTSTFEPLFQFEFHDTWRSHSGDRQDEVEEGLTVILESDTVGLNDDYVAAKLLLRDLVGARYEPEYRVPVSLVLAPHQLTKHGAKAWCQSMSAFVWETQAQEFAESSCFELVGVTLYGWQLRVDESLASLVSELLVAQIQVPELSLKLIDVHGICTGRILNHICARAVAAARLVENIGMHASALDPFIQACSSLMEARSPKRLTLYEAFGQDPVERGTKWRWLGYALSGDHVRPTSIQHLRIEDARLSAADVRNLIGDVTDSRFQQKSPPSSASGLGHKRCVQLSPDACVFVGEEYWHTLNALGLTDDEMFVVIENDNYGERMEVLVSGFGVCQVQCASVIDAVEMPASSTIKFPLSSLDCNINNCEPEALHLLSSTFGATLTRLKLSLGDELVLTRPEADAFVEAFPLLEFLDLDHVGLGSMDVLLSAYERDTCRVAVLSMTNSYVEPASMTRFAQQLYDSSRRVAQRLREFRFVFEDHHVSANDACPTIITVEGAAAFCDVLHNNQMLTFVDIGLTQAVYDQYFDVLTAFDKVKAAELRTTQHSAFLSVLRTGSSSPVTKKTKRKGVQLPGKHRRRVVSHIWGFLRPCVRRVVSIICVPRE